MPRTSSPAGLAGLLEQQSSVVSRGQLLALGMKDSAMQYRVRRRPHWGHMGEMSGLRAGVRRSAGGRAQRRRAVRAGGAARVGGVAGGVWCPVVAPSGG